MRSLEELNQARKEYEENYTPDKTTIEMIEEVYIDGRYYIDIDCVNQTEMCNLRDWVKCKSAMKDSVVARGGESEDGHGGFYVRVSF